MASLKLLFEPRPMQAHVAAKAFNLLHDNLHGGIIKFDFFLDFFCDFRCRFSFANAKLPNPLLEIKPGFLVEAFKAFLLIGLGHGVSDHHPTISI